MNPETLLHLNDANFSAEVLKAPGVVLVDFWATWCGPCRAIAPVVADIATQYAGRVKVGKLDVDEAGRTAADYRITSIPTLLIFKDGKVVQEIVGAVPKSRIVEALDRALAR